MRTLIVGSRTIWEPEYLYEALKLCGWADEITEVVSRGEPGVDRLGEQYARGAGLPVYRYSANWEKYGPGADYIRNQSIAEHIDAMLAVWDGESYGTADMIQRCIDCKVKKMYGHRL